MTLDISTCGLNRENVILSCKNSGTVAPECGQCRGAIGDIWYHSLISVIYNQPSVDLDSLVNQFSIWVSMH